MSAQGITKTVLATGLSEAIFVDYPNWPPLLPAGAVSKWLDDVASILCQDYSGRLHLAVERVAEMEAVALAHGTNLTAAREQIVEQDSLIGRLNVAKELADAYLHRRETALGPDATKRLRKARKAYRRSLE